MPTAAADFVFVIFVAMVGAAIGWFLRGGHGFWRDSGANGNEIRYAREVLSRLREVAAHVAADVGKHSSRVEEINEALHSNAGRETEAVVSAVDRLLEANRRMQEQLASADERLQTQARQIESHAAEARTDPLTGLANRRALDTELARRLAEFQRHNRTFSVMMVDVDHFKKFNDTHGHQAGDAVLRGLAKALRTTARDMDLVARYGGEEFAVVLPGTPIAAAGLAAERFRRAIEATAFRFQTSDLHVTASLGVAELLANEGIAGLVARADAALYSSKHAGRNRVCWHDGTASRPFPVQPSPSGATPRVPSVRGVSNVSAKPRPTAEGPAGPPLQKTPTREVKSAVASESAPAPRDGLREREAFEATLGRRLRQWRCGGPAPAALLVRIDDFAEIVAAHGETAGDLVRREAAALLRATVRDTELAAHYDPATLAVLLTGANLAATVDAAERLRDAASRCRLATQGDEVQFTLSVSAAAAMGEDSESTLLQRAEQALKAALQSGGNCSYFHNGQWSEIAATAPQAAG